MGMAAVSISSGEESAAKWLRQLTDEAYPRRVEAERELALWAMGRDEKTIDWLFRTWNEANDPELKSRLYRVMRERVLMDLERERPGFVGIQMLAMEFGGAGGEGAVPGVPAVGVGMVTPGSPAEKARLQAGDMILELNGEGWTSPDPTEEFAGRVGKLKPGTEVQLTVSRGRKSLEIALRLAPRPWSAGEFGQLQQLRAGVWRGNLQLLMPRSESEARDEAFRKWLAPRIPPRKAGS